MVSVTHLQAGDCNNYFNVGSTPHLDAVDMNKKLCAICPKPSTCQIFFLEEVFKWTEC